MPTGEKKTIIFVCTGNTCRSPMAAGAALDIVKQRYDGRIEVFSAGIRATPGEPATPEAVEALGEMGIDLSEHRAQLLTPQHIQEADLVLVMTNEHKQVVEQLTPKAAGKVFLLTEYTGASGEVDDPLGQPLEVYQKYASRLYKLVDGALERFNSK